VASFDFGHSVHFVIIETLFCPSTPLLLTIFAMLSAAWPAV